MSESTTSVSTGTVIWPTFVYRDAKAAITFLEQAFGFETKACYSEGDVVHHAELAWPGGGGIMLGGIREGMALECQPPGVGSAYIVVDNPDALYDRAKAAGANITRELRDETDYESRGFTCRDPEGVYWSFGTYPGVTGE
ncbi:VOC family protein [Nocardia sp. CDC160]|uniref:VOC family protein n=1 Tax=Nocardia sp. CDC160 TaxID=3112166 RepID=UPI002DBF2D82|nr:VOC family protein [Nocardia sp. CDC160]MEC3916624.1 VOC family protein [Nocardia sp. CDC160]